ncbi:MAG: FecR domain-containing protein, partial [Alphaproteobacteria bacterium]
MKRNSEIQSRIDIMSPRRSLRSYRSLAVSLVLALVFFAGTTIMHAQEMDLNEFEALIGTGQARSAISSEQAMELATGDSEADIELLSDYFASNGRDAEGVARMAADMIRELSGDPDILADAAARIADAATDALNAQYVTRFDEDEDFSLPEGAIGFDFATPDSKQISGYERVTPSDGRIESNGELSGLRRPTDKPVVAHGIVGVKKFTTEMPNGIYRVTLITDDLGDWSKFPRPFGNRIRVNDQIVRVLTKDPSDWILDAGKEGSSPLGGDAIDFAEKGLQFPRIDPEILAGNARYGEPIGRVDTVQGFATVVRVDFQTETLTLGVPLYKGDKLKTGTGSSLGLLLGDETTVAMDAKAEMVLDDLVYNPDENSGSLSISILDGLFTMNSGKIAATDDQAMIVRTPRAMSAIRGTNPGFDVDADAGTENFFNLPDSNTGAFGSFTVSSTATGEEILISGDFDVFLLDESGDLAPLD